MTGGLQWQMCIIPMFCLGIALICALERINNWGIIVAIGFVFLYGISLFITKGNFQNGLYESEKLLLFPLALVLGTAVNKKTVQYAVYTASFIVAVVGLIAYCGFATVNDFVINSNGMLRLQSLLRYANTTACLLGCGYIIAINIYCDTSKRIHLYFSAIILLAMFLTVSKATIPIFVGVGTLVVFKKKEIASNFLFQLVITGILMFPIIFSAKKYLYFPVAMLMVICIVACTFKPRRLTENLACKMWAMMLTVGMLAVVVLFLIKPSFFSTFTQRLIYMKDALKIVPQRILFGWGAGSWKVLQYKIQSTQYDVTYIHNGFLQFLFENGIIFTVGFIALCIGAFWMSVKKNHYDFATVILLISIHSIVDFDLSFGIILIIFGLICGQITKTEPKSTGKFILPIASGVMIAIISVASIYMITEYVSRNRFESLCLAEKYDAALVQAERLEKICPKDSTLKMNIAALVEKTDNDKRTIKKKINEAKELSPYDPEIFEGYMIYNTTSDNILDLCEEYIEMKPRHEETYRNAKKTVKNACEFGIIDERKKTNTLNCIDEIRFKNKVYDRDELLDRLVKERGK